MNFIIFGGCGFIGTHLANYINENEDGNPVVIKCDIDNKLGTDFVKLDVREIIQIPAINNVSSSIIYNLAAIHTTPGHLNEEYFETNILGAQNICNFARLHDIKTIVFTSSIAPYGPSEDLKEETSIPMPNSPYGMSKLTAEYIHKLWQAEDPARKLIIVRPGVVFGKFEGGNFTRLYNALKKEMFFYPGRRDTIKASIYVKDVARILYHASLDGQRGTNTYNLTYFPAPTIEEICETMASVTGVKTPRLLLSVYLLNTVAFIANAVGAVVGKKINGIHPDRVKKLMLSTNISGKKLNESAYQIQFKLKDAILDWFDDCERTGLF